MGLVPGMLILCVALALTVLGLLLIPFAIVAYLLAAAGAVDGTSATIVDCVPVYASPIDCACSERSRRRNILSPFRR